MQCTTPRGSSAGGRLDSSLGPNGELATTRGSGTMGSWLRGLKGEDIPPTIISIEGSINIDITLILPCHHLVITLSVSCHYPYLCIPTEEKPMLGLEHELASWNCFPERLSVLLTDLSDVLLEFVLSPPPRLELFILVTREIFRLSVAWPQLPLTSSIQSCLDIRKLSSAV